LDQKTKRYLSIQVSSENATLAFASVKVFAKAPTEEAGWSTGGAVLLAFGILVGVIAFMSLCGFAYYRYDSKSINSNGQNIIY
jgi:hypothetical protein